MISYRNATPADAALLSDLGKRTFVETFGHLYSPEDLEIFLENHSVLAWQNELADSTIEIHLAFDGDIPAGYAKIGPPSLPFEPVGRPAELRQIYVLKPWQGAGIAAHFMDWVIARAHARGADSLYLSVFTDNHRARRFYEGYGFEFVQPYAFMVGTHADEDLILRLDLTKKGA